MDITEQRTNGTHLVLDIKQIHNQSGVPSIANYRFSNKLLALFLPTP